jgi:cytochrome c556
LKFFAGATARSDRQVFTASYGVEFGSTLTGDLLDFTKHVFDFGYGLRFVREPANDKLAPVELGVHKAIDIEVRTSAGIIQNQGQVPVAERFYGGNRVTNFIAGNSWVIPSGALIRSIPVNHLGGLQPNGVIGGTRFYSGNLTVAKALWGRPLLPRELADDPQFVPVLDGAMQTARGELVDFYESKDKAFSAAKTDLDSLTTEIQNLGPKLNTIKAAGKTSPAITSAVNAIQSSLPKISRTLGSISKGDKSETASLIKRQLPALERELKNLQEQLTAAGQSQGASSISQAGDSVEQSKQNLIANLAKVDVKAAEAHADADFAPARKVLRAFLYELNIYSVAPAAIFDVARVWPTDTPTRYGVGGGVRLSLVNVNFTVGYAANPKRRSGEGAGALFVSLDVSDMFH